jgi:hypothetical protein
VSVQRTLQEEDPALLRKQGLPAGPVDVRVVTRPSTCRAALEAYNRGYTPRDSLLRLRSAVVVPARSAAPGTVVFVVVDDRGGEAYVYFSQRFQWLAALVALDWPPMGFSAPAA